MKGGCADSLYGRRNGVRAGGGGDRQHTHSVLSATFFFMDAFCVGGAPLSVLRALYQACGPTSWRALPCSLMRVFACFVCQGTFQAAPTHHLAIRVPFGGIDAFRQRRLPVHIRDQDRTAAQLFCATDNEMISCRLVPGTFSSVKHHTATSPLLTPSC